jgi:hypothetical protein
LAKLYTLSSDRTSRIRVIFARMGLRLFRLIAR